MRHGSRHLMTALLGAALLIACKPSVPEQYIQPGDMEDLLYDYHVSQGMASLDGPNQDYKRQLYFEAVLKKHGVTRADFDSSLVYYYTRADRFQEIYKNVEKRLANEALVLGASTSEVERYATQSLSGDTADVWEGQRHVMLMPQRPYHLMQFYQEADSSYHEGDNFLMTFNTTYLSQGINKTALAYLAVTYENDSTVSQNMTISSSSTTTLRIASCKERVKDIRGYVVMDYRPDYNNNNGPKENTVCLLFLDRIQLIRFHQKMVKVPEAVEDQSVNQMDTRQPDTLRKDSMRPHVRRLGERPQIAKPITQ